MTRLTPLRSSFAKQAMALERLRARAKDFMDSIVCQRREDPPTDYEPRPTIRSHVLRFESDGAVV